MDYEISLSEGESYIIFRVSGAMTVELSRTAGPELMRVSKENNLTKFLFDVREAPNVETPGPNWWFANRDIEDFGFSRDFCSAFLVNPSDESHSFIETAFLNAGFNVRSFTDEDSAVAWLEEDS